MKEHTENKEITHKAKSYTGVYALHKYWGKKPYNIISDFIKKYTKPYDIVLDPFSGSGVSVLEAVFNKRKGFGIDINPSAVFITEQLLSGIDPQSLAKEFSALEADIKADINELYVVKRDRGSYIGQNFLWENNELTEIRYSNGGRKRITTYPEDSDLRLADSFSINDIPYFFPKNAFFYNSRINTNNKDNISELFTTRNLLALSVLHNRIEKIEDTLLKNIFLFCFTSAIGQASKMVFVIKRRNKTKEHAAVSHKKEIGSWVIGYWTPHEFFENNVWTCFETRFKKILKAKKSNMQY
ncbi:DNA methyltransferase [Desulfonema magnum]|uniref:Methyltransferase n=1 Tax=Desulfonema magnum TaxID=45655 RepID=A0A975BSK2_9BACT|nr:DNA methyltransferase [Desulfonema magnum]QTA90952.1 SAM-dependent methyltransferase domain-containing protein [Desulfonema magnum]